MVGAALGNDVKDCATLVCHGPRVSRRLNILDRLHTRLLDIVGTALPLITASARDADFVGLAHLRMEMICAMAEYARYVQQHVVDAALAGADPEQIRLAQEIKIGSIALQRSYQSFADRWLHRDGMANWPEYRLSAIVMMKQVRSHVRDASRWQPAQAEPKPPA